MSQGRGIKLLYMLRGEGGGGGELVSQQQLAAAKGGVAIERNHEQRQPCSKKWKAKDQVYASQICILNR